MEWLNLLIFSFFFSMKQIKESMQLHLLSQGGVKQGKIIHNNSMLMYLKTMRNDRLKDNVV